MKYFSKSIKTPVGNLTLVASDTCLRAILWENEDLKRAKIQAIEKNEQHPILILAEKQLNEYFKGIRKKFDLPIDFYGTQFQNKVWKGLTKIPYGKTQSYSELAKRIGSEKASRAVGAANGRNPIPIVVPCHRVIGQSGRLTGFAGGLENKAFLLKLEGVQ